MRTGNEEKRNKKNVLMLRKVHETGLLDLTGNGRPRTSRSLCGAAWCSRWWFTWSMASTLASLCFSLKNRSFQYGKVALAVRTQYHQLQFMLKVVAIFTDTCMSLVQTVCSLLLPDFLSADPVVSICRRSRSSAEQNQSLSGNSSNFLAL